VIASTEIVPVVSGRVASVRSATVGEWRAVADADEGATFFHGPAWAELWEAYTEGAVRPDPRLVEFADGRSAILGISRVPTRIPGLMRDALSPEGNWGGWVSADVLGDGHLRSLAEVVLDAPSCVWRIGPSDERLLAVAPEGGREESTHLIDLRDGAAAAGALWRQEARRLASRARRQGVRVREGTSPRDWQTYVDLYHASVERWGRPLVTYRDSLFPLISGRADQGIRLWLAELDGEACAGAVVLSHRRYASGWLSAATPERCPGAGNLLHWELLERLADQGIHTYDLGGSGPLSGVVRFKESLGAKRARVLAYERRHPLERAASTVKRRLGRKQ
jgi:CelD/BcsL family acetyltransferase involved in cellulose biosynthesis